MDSISFRRIYKKPIFESIHMKGILLGMGFSLSTGACELVILGIGWFAWKKKRIFGSLYFSSQDTGKICLEKKLIHERYVVPMGSSVYTKMGIYLGKVGDLFLSDDLSILLKIYVTPRFYGPTYVIHRQQILTVYKNKLIVSDAILELKFTSNNAMDTLISLGTVSMTKEK